MTKREPTDEQFVQAWIEAVRGKTGLKALSVKLNMGYQDASIRASILRRAGVRLPTMPHPNQKHNSLQVDTKKLNKMIVDEFGESSLRWRNR